MQFKYELENKALKKGIRSLMESRKKWKHRYYNIKRKYKKTQKDYEQIYNDYQDIGKLAFELQEEKENLIKRLKDNNEADAEIVKHFEKQYRYCTDEFYKKSYKRTIDMANARREVRKSILNFLKGEKE